MKEVKKTTELLFLVVADSKTRSNNHELWLRRFRIGIRENLLEE